MRTPRIIDGAVFGPEQLKLVERAFDEAWVAIEDKFDRSTYAEAREHLSEAIVLSLREESSCVEILREAGIRAMRLKYPSLFEGAQRQRAHAPEHRRTKDAP